MLLYHFNFGYPLLQADTLVEASKAERTPMNELSTDYHHMMAPVDGRGEDAAVLVVCVVAAELHAAGCGKVKDLLHGISLRIVWHQYSAPRAEIHPPPRRVGLVSAGELC